jgi:hypothetical protein
MTADIKIVEAQWHSATAAGNIEAVLRLMAEKACGHRCHCRALLHTCQRLMTHAVHGIKGRVQF